MKEAIRAIIADLDAKFVAAIKQSDYTSANVLEHAMDKMEEVLKLYADNPSERIPADTERVE